MSRLSLGPRAQAGIVIALVAVVGALLGILGDRLVAQQRTPQEPAATMQPAPGRAPGMMRPEMVRRYGQVLSRELDLTEAQRAQIDSIMMQERLRIRELNREFQPRFRQIAEQTRERVDAVLTPEQRERLRSMRAERIRRMGDGPMFREGRPRADRP